jgi:hypothetical protein
VQSMVTEHDRYEIDHLADPVHPHV